MTSGSAASRSPASGSPNPGPPNPGHLGLPSPEQVTELLSGAFAGAGYEIEAVTVDTARRPAHITVVADGDVPADLDSIAELSRLASERLDTLDTGAAAYILEVTSPGVDRPLTAEKHFRRARGRKVQMRLADGSALTGRIAAARDGTIDLVVPQARGWGLRTVLLAEVGNAVVQVEFSPPKPPELELLDRTEDQR